MQLALMPSGSHRCALGATLIELLVVAGLVAALAGLVAHGLADRSPAPRLAAAQAELSSALAAARLGARASGHRARVLIGNEAAQPDRFLRLVVVEVATEPGANPTIWRTVQRFTLPAGVFVVPAALAGIVAEEGAWRRPSDQDAALSSDLLSGQTITASVGGEGLARWLGVAFSAYGTVAPLAGGPPPKGALLVSAGRRLPGASVADGEPPVQLLQPESVRGLLVSAYGTITSIDSRDAL